MISRLTYRFRVLVNLIEGRSRARLLSIQGASVGGKCHLDRRVRVDYPWTVSLGARCTLEQDVWIKVVGDRARVGIGEYSFLGRGVEIDASKQVSIGSHVLIAPGVFITDHGHNTKRELMIDAQGCAPAPVVIEDDVWIGARAIIMPGVTISRGAVVGAGAVVTKSLPEYSINVGVPTREIARRS